MYTVNVLHSVHKYSYLLPEVGAPVFVVGSRVVILCPATGYEKHVNDKQDLEDTYTCRFGHFILHASMFLRIF